MPDQNIMNSKKWYSNGLRFSCRQCGRCCTGEPGYVWLTREDTERICDSLSISINEFLKNYCRSVNGHISLLEYQNGDCIFFDGVSRCKIYTVRPAQCRQFPFWPHILESQSAWDMEKKRCPGIGHGKRRNEKEIKKKAGI